MEISFEKRTGNIDLLRVVCALAVVAIHVVTAPAAMYNGDLPSALLRILNIIHSLGNPAIPLFFIMTGYCLIKKEKCTYKYCLIHVLKYVAVLFTVGLFFAFLEEYFMAGTINSGMFPRSVLRIVRGDGWAHMWFIYAIIGVYLVMPVIHTFFKMGGNGGIVLTGLLFLFTIFLPAFGDGARVGIDFPFGGYLFYVCYGCLVAKMDINRAIRIVAALAVVVGVCIIIFYGEGPGGYKSPVICMIAVSVFAVFDAINIAERRFLRVIAVCTWGCYLIHPFFINFILKVFKIDMLSFLPGLKLLGLWSIVSIISIGTTYLLRKVPLVKMLF